MKHDPQETLRQALGLAGGILRKHAGKARISYKGRANIVTQADLESQEAVLKLITSRFPDHDYRAEEDAVKDTGAEHVWVIDPLDGTTNYAHGYPAYCVSIGVLRGGRPWLAGIYDPTRDELFTAERGRGTQLNGRSIRVSAVKTLEESLLVTGFPYDRAKRPRKYIEEYRRFMVQCHDVRRSGSAALDLAWLSAGRSDGFWEHKLSPWDVAAGTLLVAEAGGTMTDFSGEKWTGLASYGWQTLASNGRIHQAMIEVLRT